MKKSQLLPWMMIAVAVIGLSFLAIKCANNNTDSGRSGHSLGTVPYEVLADHIYGASTFRLAGTQAVARMKQLETESVFQDMLLSLTITEPNALTNHVPDTCDCHVYYHEDCNEIMEFIQCAYIQVHSGTATDGITLSYMHTATRGSPCYHDLTLCFSDKGECEKRIITSTDPFSVVEPPRPIFGIPQTEGADVHPYNRGG